MGAAIVIMVRTQVSLVPGPAGWSRAQAATGDHSFRGRWRRRAGLVVVVLGDPTVGVPADVPAGAPARR